jgi:hypothetical protein
MGEVVIGSVEGLSFGVGLDSKLEGLSDAPPARAPDLPPARLPD